MCKINRINDVLSDQSCRAHIGDSLWLVFQYPQTYSEPSHGSNMERFAKPLSVFTKHPILDIWQGSEVTYPVDTGRKLNLHKTFRRHYVRLIYVLCLRGWYPLHIREYFIQMKNHILRVIFRTLSKIYDGAFCKKSYYLKAVNYFP